MKWKLSRPDPRIMVYYFMKLIGLAPFTVNEIGFHPPTLLDKLYSASVATGYLFLAVKTDYSTFVNFEGMKITRVAELGTFLQISISVPSTFLTIMIFLFMHEQILYITNKLRVMTSEFKSLGIEQDQGKMFKNILMTTAKTHALVIPVIVATIVMERYLDTLTVLKFAIEDFIYINTILAFTQILFFIKQFFKLLNEKLSEILGPAGHCRSLNNSPIFVVSRNNIEQNQAVIKHLTDLQTLRKIQGLYLELCNLVSRTTRLFAIPILWKTFQSCTALVLYNFWIYYMIRNLNQFANTGTLWFLTDVCILLLKMFLVIFYFTAVAKASVGTCEEGNAIRTVLFRGWYKFKPRHLEDEFIMFSLQLLNKPVIVSAFGLLDLGYSCLYKVLCTAAAYAIIMIQFDTSEPRSGA